MHEASANDNATITSSRKMYQPEHENVDLPVPRKFDFEDDLNASWVYRRALSRVETISTSSSSVKHIGWSALSALDMSDLSFISLLSLPIARSELANSSWYPPEQPQQDTGHQTEVNTGAPNFDKISKSIRLKHGDSRETFAYGWS